MIRTTRGHNRAAADLVSAMLIERSIWREGEPLVLVRHGAASFSLAGLNGARPAEVPTRTNLEAVIDWMQAEWRGAK